MHQLAEAEPPEAVASAAEVEQGLVAGCVHPRVGAETLGDEHDAAVAESDVVAHRPQALPGVEFRERGAQRADTPPRARVGGGDQPAPDDASRIGDDVRQHGARAVGQDGRGRDTLAAVRERFADLPTDTASGQLVSVTGRVVLARNGGKLCFATLQESTAQQTAQLQVMVSLDGVGAQRLAEGLL